MSDNRFRDAVQAAFDGERPSETHMGGGVFGGWEEHRGRMESCPGPDCGPDVVRADALAATDYTTRYRLAWISARRRAADEANYAREALELKDEEIRRLTSENADMRRELSALRESTSAPRLTPMGDVDGDEVWKLS